VADTVNYADIKKEFHPEPHVNNHLGQVATLAIEADDNWAVVYAAVLHDIAKNTPDQPKKWAQHAYRGAMLIASDVTDKVQWLVAQHMRAIDYVSGKMRPHKRQALEDSPWFEDLLRLHQYDTGGRKADGKHLPWDTIYSHLDSCDPRTNQVIVMIGIQASGKSTVSNALVDASRDHGEWWKPKFERTSKDDLRLLLGAGPGAYRHQESCVHRIQRQAIRMALGRGQGVIVDNCHNTIKRRRDTLEWLREEFPGIHVTAHFVHAPLDVCIARNRDEHGQPHRHRLQIPDKVLKQFHGDLVNGLGKDWSDGTICDKLLAEGFDEVDITRTA
jgi:predicted kinase